MNPIDQETLPTCPRHDLRAVRARARTIAAGFAFALASLLCVAGNAQAATGDNVALGKPVTMSGSPSDPTLIGANCTDGNRSGNYPTDNVCWTGVTQSGANREWIEVDLGQDTIVDRVRLSNRTDGSNGDFARWIVITTRPSSLTGMTADPQSTLDPVVNPNAPFVNKLAYASGTNVGASYGTGQGDPWTTLDLKIGTHIARYVRIYTMKSAATLNLAEIEVFEGPPPTRTIANTSFEQPAIPAASVAQVSETQVPGWSTTEPVAIPGPGFGTPFIDGGNIEMWSSGFGGVTADAGNQFVELNAYSNGALSPAPLCVYPGESFQWKVSHRARGNSGDVDVARLRINGQDIATFRDGVIQADTHTCTPAAGFDCTAQAGSPTATGWGRWQGNWTNTLTQPKAMTFEFAAISSAAGSSAYGNFIDNVSITGLTAAVEFSSGSATGPESVATANLPMLLVNGSVATAQTIELSFGGTAIRGDDYTTNPATGPVVITIPAGAYDGTAATAISLAPYLQIVTDSVIEGAETIILQLSNASAGLSVAGASGCRPGIAESVYTITDEAVPTLSKSFGPDTIPYGGVATMTFLVDNSAAGSITRAIGFTDNLAAGLQVANPASAITTCSGTLNAVPDGNQVTLGGGSVAAGAICSVVVNITNRPGFSGLCYNPNFANENQNLVGLQNLIAQISQYTCVSVTPPDCPDAATTNGFGNISGLSPNLNNGISGQCLAINPTIELIKISEGGTGSFGFTLGNTSATNPLTIVTAAPGAPGTSGGIFDVVDIGLPVTIAETGLPAGWTLSDIACQLADGSAIGSFDVPSATWSVAPGSLAYGQRITCTAVNQSPASVTVTKALTGESGSVTGVAEPGEQLTYTITLSNTGSSPALNQSITDQLDPNVIFVSADNGGALAGSQVQWTGLTVPANGSLQLIVVVQVIDPIPAGVTRIGNVAYDPSIGPPDCTITPIPANCTGVPTSPSVSISKLASTPVPTGTPNEYAITYTVTATNSGGSIGSYDLADVLTFNGAAVTAIGTPIHASTTGDTQDGTLGSFAAPAGGTIVSGESIGAQGSETWTYAVVYTITDADVAADCTSAAGGLRNRAALGGAAGGASPAETCSGAANVSIVKAAAQPVATGTANQFTLTYTVNVTNTGTLAGTYALADTLSFNGATVDAISAVAYSSATDTQDGTLGTFAPPSGGTIVTGESISAGGTETWIYTVTYTITNSGVTQDCASPDGGLRNDAQLGGSLSGQSTTCTGAPAVVIGKSASGPTPTGNPNEYRLNYLVTVQNNGTLVGLYNLDDSFTFGGVSNVAVSAVTHGGSDPLGTVLGTLTTTGGTIVSGETIAVGADETYAYSVTFTIDDAATVGTCANGGGLANQASLGGSSSGQVGTCSDVPDIVIAKTASAPSPTGTTNQYTLDYTVTVSNAGAAGGSYDLADAFVFAGATVDSISAVAHAGPDPLATTLGTLTSAGGTIVSGETIAAASSESYTYTVTFTLTDPATAADCANPAGGLRNTAALGGSATGDAATCTGAPNVSIAKTLTGENGTQAGIAEPGEQLTYTIMLTNSGGSAATNYGVTDRLDVNTAFVSATNGGTHAGGLVSWTGLTVPANGTLSLTVVVSVADPIPSGVTQIGNVVYETGTTPPACPPAGAQCVIVPTAADVTIAKALTGENGTQTGIAEPGEQLTYTITLSNTGGSDAINYGVTDQLDANTSFVSATNGGTHAGGLVNWTGLTVPANGTLTLTVIANVVDPIPAGVTQIGNVAYETGTTPPSCPPAGGQCVIVPTAGAVTIAKALTGESGTQAGIAEPGEQLTYTITLTNTGGSDVLNYAVTDQLDANTAFVSATNGGTHAGGVVNWTGLTVPANGSLTLTVVVSVVDPIPAGVTRIGNVAYETGTTPPSCPPAGGQCVIVPTASQVAITKTASAPASTGTPKQYQITYVVTATNTGGSVGTYDLADTMSFNGATVTAISAPLHGSTTGDSQSGTLGSFVAPAGGTIVSGETIDAQGVETWTYTVTYAITDAALAADCAAPTSGLRNAALLGGGSAGAPAATTCTGAPRVNIVKTAGAPLATSNPNEFTLTYTVDVINTGSLIGVYDLSDALTFNGATVTAISAPAYGSPNGETQDGTLGTFGAPAGGTIVSGEVIGVGGQEIWTYTVTYTVVDAGLAQDCASPDGGLRNSAALGGSFSGQSTTCTGAAAIVIGKSVSGPTPTGNPNEYVLDYLVSVQNNGTLTGVYDLSDTFTFPGVSGVVVSAVTHGGPDPLGTTLGTLTPAGGTIVSTETIAANSSETYAYNVVFTIDDAAAVGSCTSGGGLVNRAALGGSAAGQVDTCSGVPDIAVAKSAGAATPTGTPNQYTLAYTVTVTNGGGASGVYDLSDTFTFAGATIDAVSAVTHAGPDPLLTTLGTLAPTGGTIVTDESIAAGSSESYSYIVTFTLTDPTAAADCTNPAVGLRNLAALGGSASGDAATCTGSPNVAITKLLSGESGTQAGIAEPGEQLTYTITLSNTGGSDATNFGVTDQLDANTSFVSATNGGTHAAGLVMWAGLTVPANGTLVLTVVVTVNDPLPPGVSQIANVAYETGTTPPSCPPAGGQCVVIPTAGAVTIVKSVSDASSNGQAEPGETLTYTIVLTNTGGSVVTGYELSDRLDPNTSFVSATNGGVLAGGLVTWSGLTIPANGTLTLTLVVTVNNPLPAGVMLISNVAYHTGDTPPDCSANPQPANCAELPVVGTPRISVTKTADVSGTVAGGSVVYTITVRNVGDIGVANVVVSDPMPVGVASYAWTCAEAGGVICPNASGAGAINETIPAFPSGGQLVYTVTAVIAANAPANIVNTVSVTPSDSAVCAPDNSPPPCRAQTPIVVGAPSTPVQVPLGDRWMLLMMALLLTGAVWTKRRRSIG
jgi:uncharacterized repeat protein (TIGR01451 family)